MPQSMSSLFLTVRFFLPATCLLCGSFLCLIWGVGQVQESPQPLLRGDRVLGLRSQGLMEHAGIVERAKEGTVRSQASCGHNATFSER